MDDQDQKPPVDNTQTRRYRRPSDRMFRRSRAAQERRRVKDKSDFRLIMVLLQFSVLAALILVAAGVFTQRSLTGDPIDISGLASWAVPWLGPFSKIELIGFVLLVLFSIYLLRKWKTR